jgi:hypothetical protein
VNRFPARLFVPVVLFMVACQLTQFTPAGNAQASQTGQWQTLPYTMPINPVHVSLLYTGKVLVVSGTGNNPANPNIQAALWDPQAGTIAVQPLSFDMFCNGMVTLPDGRALIAGGTIAYAPPAFLGSPRVSIYDPATGLFTDQPSMAHGRWYPTLTTLGDGSVIIFSGLSDTGPTNSTIERFSVSSGLGPELATPWTPPLYPRLHLLPNGKVFYSGLTPSSNIYDPSTNSWTMGVATTNYGNQRLYGSSVLLPLTPANGYKPRVIIMGGGATTTPATNTTEIIDLSTATPQWVYGPNMSHARIEMDATMLPNGKIVALGGSTNDEDASTAALGADLYDPSTNSFSSAGTEAFARLYHTVSLLMPDATVWVAGGNPAQGNYEPHMEIYSPPYLFNADGSLATRPTISSVSTSKIGYGSTLSLQTPDSSNISSVVLMRNGSSTHAFDMDQRHVALSFTVGSGVLNLTGPPNSNIAPPGYYMLFILNNAGVPSVATMVQVSGVPTDQAPTGTITNPASDITIGAGQSVSFAGSGADPDGSIASYYWTFFGGNPGSSNLANPGSVTYTTPGPHVATFTVTDNQGLADPHPPSRKITVTDFSLGVAPTLASAAQGGSTLFTILATGGNNFTGNVNLSVTGLPTGATASFNPTSITNSGSSTMTVSVGTAAVGTYSLKITASTGALTHTATVSLVVSPSNSTAAIGLGSGFSATGMQLNGHSRLNGSRLQLTDNTAGPEQGTGFWTTPVNIQAFTTDFVFQLTNPGADGFTFILQNGAATALGGGGSGLGFQGLAKSVAVKFDLWDNTGEGNNSTGLYTNGALPTLPATTLGNGLSLHSGDVFEARITYDGTNLALTLTDTATSASFTTSWPVNIPNTVGGNTAYAGFGGGTGGQTATQEILAWNYSTASAQPVAATPVITPGTGTYTTAQTVSIADSTAGSTIYYTLDGSAPTTSSTKYTNGFTVSAATTVKAIATAPGFVTSASATSVITIQSGGTLAINFGSGFSAAGMQFNGHTLLNGTRLQLTDASTTFEQASAYWTAPVNVQSFSTDFTFQLTNANADGFTFLLQTSGLTGMGTTGGGLGFAGLAPSVAVKFDLFDNNGEGANSTGLYTNGFAPSTPASTLGGGVDLHSGDVFQVHLTYDGATLTMTITDKTIPADSFTTSWPINIPATLGGNTAFAGFSGGTGGLTAIQEILTWTYSIAGATTSAGTPTFAPAAGTYTGTQSVIISDTTAGSTIFYTLDGSAPATAAGGSTAQYIAPVSVTKSLTINAIATAPGFSGSATGTAAYVINLPAAATPTFSPTGGTYTSTQSVTISDITMGSAIFYTLDGSTPATAAGGSTFQYTTPVSVTASKTLRAIATAPGFSASAIGTASYVINSAAAAMPVITPATGTFATAQTVTITDSSPGATIYYTLDGTSPTTSSTKYAAAFSVSRTTTVKAIATAAGFTTSATATSVVTIQAGTTLVSFGSGFSATGMRFNGHARLTGTRLQLTDNSTTYQQASAYWTTKVNVQSFTTDFTFQLTNASADGFTFLLQNAGLTAMGTVGGGLGFAGLSPSVAVKFDLYNNDGEGTNSTGLYVNGSAPSIPATTLGGGVNIHNGHAFRVHLVYNGTMLTMTITDTVSSNVFTIAWTVNIPGLLGNTAYAGFTGATGGGTATQEVLTWTYVH